MGSERRQVTVFFAGISGFANLSERQDAESVTTLMNECFAIVTQG